MRLVRFLFSFDTSIMIPVLPHLRNSPQTLDKTQQDRLSTSRNLCLETVSFCSSETPPEMHFGVFCADWGGARGHLEPGT